MARLKIDLDAASEGPHWLSRRADTSRETAREFVQRRRRKREVELKVSPFGEIKGPRKSR